MKNIKKKVNTEAAYEILDNSTANNSTWTSGGCFILARALNILTGYPIIAIYNNKYKSAEHFGVLGNNGYIIDADGDFATKDSWIRFLVDNEHPREGELVAIPYYDGMGMDGIPIDEDASVQLANYLKGKSESKQKWLKEIVKSVLNEEIESSNDCSKYFDMDSVDKYDGLTHPLYFLIEKRKAYKLKFVDPVQYIHSIARGFGVSYADALAHVNMDRVKKYAKEMVQGDKFTVGFYEDGKPNQEGRHRALALIELGCKSMPVVVIHEVTDSYLDSIVNKFKDYSFEELDNTFKKAGYKGIGKLDYRTLQNYVNFKNPLNEDSIHGDGFDFIEDYYDYRDGQNDIRMDMLKDGVKLAYATYSKYKDKIYINFIESTVRGHEYGFKLMQHLADLYGYENLERTSLTSDGVKMREKLDKFYNFDYKKHLESQNKHLDISVLDGIKNKTIKNFILNMVKDGYELTWNKWLSKPGFREFSDNLLKKYDIDFNDIAEISTWIKNSKTNNNLEDDEPGHVVISDLEKIQNIV